MTDRNAMIGRLHQLKAIQRLDDDTYRDKLEQITGKRSAADLTDAELSLCLNNFHVKQTASHPHHAKIKALYIAAFNLGLFGDGSDRGIDGFVKRQTGKERLTFVSPVDAKSVVEALKAMLSREGVLFAPGDLDGMGARRTLLMAQWAKLALLGAVRIDSVHALESWCESRYLHCHAALTAMKRQDLDAAARELGRWLRKAMKKKAAAA